MARQIGPVHLSGTIGNIIFYKTKTGYFAKAKPHFDPERFAKDPAFANMRRSMAEFSRSSKASKLVRQAFAESLTQIEDSDAFNRLHKVMLKVIKGDKTNEWGRRNPADGEIALLEGFDFNWQSPLSKQLPVRHTAVIDRKTGIITVTIPSFAGQKKVDIPKSTTHFMLQATGVELDFRNGQCAYAAAQSPDLSMRELPKEQLTLQVQLPPNSLHPLFLSLSISFLQECNGIIKPLHSNKHNAMALICVSCF
jgi:hypothetical protein